MTAPFDITKHVGDDGIAWLKVRGDIDQDVSEILTDFIVDAADQDGLVEIVVDLDETTFLAAVGLRCLLEGRAAALRRGYAYQVINARGAVERVLHLTGLAEFLGGTSLQRGIRR
ncbi:STAS domain-containing protein [Actinoplanes sp. NPDC051343]|jgi:anti-anti-sigma factor|uniref:STAS domain-containing protein n=1 Tax=Actinoplanes sp. NPDC051343 TaxID=3363906 RepID=UPI003787A0BF